MRRALILASDLIISGLLVMWFEWGRWLDLYGFTGRHPESALDYFRGFVCAGSMLFASLFALLSLVLVIASSANELVKSCRLHRCFYGNGPALLGKYSALMLSIVVSPVFYFFMWQENVSRSVRFAGGFLIESLLFFFVLVLAERFVAARATAPRIEITTPSDVKRAPA